VKATCPVWGALDGNLLLRDNKAPSFDSIVEKLMQVLQEPNRPLLTLVLRTLG